MKYAFTPAAALLAYGAWDYAPSALGEFLFIGRFCLVAAVLTAAELLFQKTQ